MDGFLSRQLGEQAEPDMGWLSQLFPNESTSALGTGRHLVAGGGLGWGSQPRHTPIPPETGPGSEGWHDYQSGPNWVCGLACSAAAMAEYLPRFAYPGQDPAVPARSPSEDYNLVEDPWDHIPAGLVKTEISKDGFTVTNTTRWLHPLYYGTVVRTARFANGGWYVTTRGSGNNVLPGMAEVNKTYGPKIFDKVDNQMREYIARDAKASNRPY